MGQSCSQPITDRLVLTDLNLEHNVFIADILCQGATCFAVYCALRFEGFRVLLYIQHLTSTR
jgi:hypothetical protein